MELTQNRKNLFIEITEGIKQQSTQQVLTNWGRPPPFTYHLINAPALNFELATLAAHPQKQQPEFFPQRNRELAKWPKRNGQRQRYKKLRDQLRLLEEQLSRSQDLHESQLLAYKQQLLVQYLGRFVDETSAECIQKGEFLKNIWNLLVRIFQGLCERLVVEGKRKESQFLRQELATHSSYQTKLEEYQAKNAELKQSDDKYQSIVKELMTSIAKLNAELKGQRALFDRTAASLAELTHKYGELRSEYLQILVNGYSETMSRERAQCHLTDKQMLLFARQLATGNHGVQAKKGRERKARIITNDLDVGLILEELQAEDDYSFQIDTGERKEVTFANQRTQTAFIGYQGDNMGVQCDYVSRCEQGQLRNRSSQTNPPLRVTQREAQNQTNPSQLLHRQLQVTRCFYYTQYPIRIEPRSSIKLVRNSSKENMIQGLGSRKPAQMEDAATCFSFQTIQDGLLVPIVAETQDAQSQAGRGLGRKDSKMIRISESRQSNKRFSKNYVLRVKTDANEASSRNSRVAKRSRDVRVSEFLALENLRQNMVKNLSNFKKNQVQVVQTLQVRLRNALVSGFQGNKSLKSVIGPALESCQKNTENSEGHNQEYLESLRNIQLSTVNQGIREKIVTWQALHSKKAVTFLPSHKCLRGISQIFKLAKRFIAIGCSNVNLINLACEWLSAIQGRPVNLENNPKKLIDFMRSCLNLYGEHYLIRNFVLLCGLQAPNRDDRLVKMSKISFDSLRQKVDGDRFNRTSDFKYRQTRETEAPVHPQASLLYSSEVAFYFDLLEALNCSDSREDLSRFYTTYDRFEEVICRLQSHYRNSSMLLAQIRQAVRLSVEDWGSQSQSKLNIFKCLQLIIQRVLTFKAQIEQEFNRILEQCGPEGLTEDLVSLSGVSMSQYIQTMVIAHRCYPKASICDLATLFLVQGLKIDLAPFAAVQKDHKITIIKRLIASRQKQKGLALSVIESFQKRAMKKTDFHLLARSMWTKQSAATFETVLGEDMLCLYACSVPYGESSAGTGFHRAARQALRLW